MIEMALPKTRSAMTAPMSDIGRASMIENGYQKFSNCAARTI